MTTITCIQCNAKKTIESNYVTFNGTKFDMSELAKFCNKECQDLHEKEQTEKVVNTGLRALKRSYPSIYRNIQFQDFTNLETDQLIDRNGKAHQCMRKVEAWIKSPYWCLFMNGDSGKGKTRLGLTTILLWYKRNNIVYDGMKRISHRFIKAMNLGLNLESERYEDVRGQQIEFTGVSMLFLDDLGTETKSQSMMIANLLDEREQNNLKTIITTNLSDEDLSERYGQRFLSRIHRGIMTKDGEYRR